MKVLATSLMVLSVTAVVTPARPDQARLEKDQRTEGFRIPTIHESAVQARRILHLTSQGTLVTSLTEAHAKQDGDASVDDVRPPELSGSPIGLMEYYADCEPDTGNPTLLAIDIATPYRNYEAGSNISLAVRWWPISKNYYAAFTTWSHALGDDDDHEIPTPHTPAALPRFSLHGRLEDVSAEDLRKKNIAACFLKTHPDSIYWQPGNDISHQSKYVRFVVEHVYWFGGFGDRARIGWLPIDDWRNVTKEEIGACTLPGERQHRSNSWWRGWL